MWQAFLGGAAGLLLLWVLLLVVLWRTKPDDRLIREALRLLPDVLRLVARLARDSSLPRGLRIRLWLLLGYLALPIDLVPDFIPVIGYADDAILLVWTLRSVTRIAGTDAVTRHWPGTPQGLQALTHVSGTGRR